MYHDISTKKVKFLQGLYMPPSNQYGIPMTMVNLCNQNSERGGYGVTNVGGCGFNHVAICWLPTVGW